MYMRVYKPLLGIMAAGTALAALSPLLLIIAMLLFLCTGKSPLFFQTRMGLQGKPFKIIKFKTMTDACDDYGNLLPDDQRLFALGNFLRTNSLDELPQLINILKGDMAFVGPRPWIPSQLNALPPRHARQRSSVRPGMTGMAQIHGRNGIPFLRRLRYDVVYTRRASFRLDCLLILQTIRKVLNREGITPCHDAFHDKEGNPLIRGDLSPVSAPPPFRPF